MVPNDLRVTGDVNPKTYTSFREFMEKNGLTESQALDRILTEYFGTALDSKRLHKQEAVRRKTAPALSPDTELGLTRQQLAAYLQCDPEQVARIQDYPDVLAEYTRDHDPKGRAWEYDSDSQRFFLLE